MAGASAGLAVDLILYPLDTVKTRMQQKQPAGTLKFHGLYRGVPSILVGSVPASAIFFAVHDTVRSSRPSGSRCGDAVVAAVLGETVACAVRVPVERVKQCRQAGVPVSMSDLASVYRGLGAMLARELPFAVLQYPLYGILKEHLPSHTATKGIREAVAGSIAGGLTAILTTPLDVCKTRVMTSRVKVSWLSVLRDVAREGALFSGVVPRTAWIALGGFIYFGVYEASLEIARDGIKGRGTPVDLDSPILSNSSPAAVSATNNHNLG